MSAKYVHRISFEELRVGDTVHFTGNGRGRGGHYDVTVTVTKKNRRTFDAIETRGSYMPGTRWNIHCTTNLYIYAAENPHQDPL